MSFENCDIIETYLTGTIRRRIHSVIRLYAKKPLSLDLTSTAAKDVVKPAIAAMHGPHSLVRFGD